MWVPGLIGLVLLSGCYWPFGSEDSNLSENEAVAAALRGAGYITHDEPILDTKVQRTTYSVSGPGETPGEVAAWKVVFKGMFYEPEGPPRLPGSPTPVRIPVCGQITVIVEDTTARELLLSFGRTSGC